MGLDMYLYRKTYVKNWDHQKPEERHEITIKGPMAASINVSRISEITEQVAYWRKANAIHKWFVDNCAGGVDNCQEVPVEVEQLRELVKLCKKVLGLVELVAGKVHTGTIYDAEGKREEYEDGQVIAQQSIAADILPTQAGFFFGSTDYDEGYVDDLKGTLKQLKPLLEDGGDFYYRASW